MPSLTNVWVHGDYTDEYIILGTVVANDEAEARDLRVDLWFGDHQWSTEVCVDPCGSREVEWTVGQLAAGSYPGGAHLVADGLVVDQQDSGKTIYEREPAPEPEPGPPPAPAPAPEPTPVVAPTVTIDAVVVRSAGRTMLPQEQIPADEPLRVAVDVSEHDSGWGGLWVSVQTEDGESYGDWVDLVDTSSATVEVQVPGQLAGTHSLTAAVDTDVAGSWTRVASSPASFTLVGPPAGMTKVNVHFRSKTYYGHPFTDYQFLASFTNEDGSKTSAGHIEDGSPGVFATSAYLSKSGSVEITCISTDEAKSTLYGSAVFDIPADATLITFDVEQRGGVRTITASSEDEFISELERQLGFAVEAETNIKVVKVNGEVNGHVTWTDTVRSKTGQSTQYQVDVGKIRLDVKQAQ